MGKYLPNKIIKYDNYAELVIYDGETGLIKAVSKIDLIDIEYVMGYRWCIRSKGYVGRVDKSGNLVLLHRVIMNSPNGMVIDHINKNRLDNTRINLRVCSMAENIKNGSVRAGKDFIGINYRKDTNKWRAYIFVNGKYLNLECYENKQDAIKARLKAEKEYFGEFSPQKHLFKLYKI